MPYPLLWDVDGKSNEFPLIDEVNQVRNLMVKNTHTSGKVWVPVSQFSPMGGFAAFSHAMGY